ncbi:hypothetical protein [Streptosporangium sp. NPDC051022]|uniref:hypothetical protein n=1 Tax=Streptosporangium sp. NPDC051022 TaxID=3155752 RepID=UPI003430EA49
MAEQHRVAALCAFVGQLKELYDLAGSPTLAHLRKLSRTAGCDPGALRELAESTTHDVLTGNRKKVPEWPWVISFVTACTLAAEQTRLDVSAMGDTQAWYQRWRAAKEARPDPPGPPAAPRTSEPAPLPAAGAAPKPSVTGDDDNVAAGPLAGVPSIPRPGAEPPPALPFASPVATAAARRPAADLAGRAAVPESAAACEPPLPDETQYLLRVYGRTGARLLRHSDPGDGQDCMRLAVVALLRGWPQEGRQWLRRAGDAGHAEAVSVFNHPEQTRAAAELACGYGRHYQRAGPAKLSVAMFFYRLAGDAGHAEAAYRLAEIHQDKGEDWAADNWFNRAAILDPPKATAWFDDVFRQLLQPPRNTGGALAIGPIELTEVPETAEPPPAD